VLELEAKKSAELMVSFKTSVITGPRFGGHGEGGPRRISYAPAEQLQMRVGLEELTSGPKRMSLGILDREISVAFLPETPPPEVAEFTFTDNTPEAGVNPYWLRVVQTDMEMAWTSPIYVDCVR
jgi:hypothetical protein